MEHDTGCIRSMARSVAMSVSMSPSGRVVGGRSRTVLPRELCLDVTTGGQGLHGLDDEQVLDGDLGVLGEVVVLLGDEDSLTEEGLSLKYLVSLMFSISLELSMSKCPNAVAESTRPKFIRDRKVSSSPCIVAEVATVVMFFDVGRALDFDAISLNFRPSLFAAAAAAAVPTRLLQENGLCRTSWIALRSALGISIVAVEFDLTTLG